MKLPVTQIFIYGVKANLTYSPSTITLVSITFTNTSVKNTATFLWIFARWHHINRHHSHTCIPEYWYGYRIDRLPDDGRSLYRYTRSATENSSIAAPLLIPLLL
jgi:hypothetical protein